MNNVLSFVRWSGFYIASRTKMNDVRIFERVATDDKGARLCSNLSADIKTAQT